jgi:hypothetical protein
MTNISTTDGQTRHDDHVKKRMLPAMGVEHGIGSVQAMEHKAACVQAM